MFKKDIDRRTADPVILRNYKRLRNERITGTNLQLVAYTGMPVFLLAIVVALLLPFSGMTRMTIILTVGGLWLLGFFTALVFYAPPGKRLQATAIIVAFIALCALLVTITPTGIL